MGAKREKPISMKIFNNRSLEDLLAFIIKIDEGMKDVEYKHLSFTVYFEDGSSLHSDKPDVLDDNKPMESFHFVCSAGLDKIAVVVRASKTTGFFSVKGEDRDWVDAKFTQLKEIIDAVPKQQKIFADQSSQIIISLMTPLPLMVIVGLYFILPITSSIPSATLITLGFLIYLGSKLIRILQKMYPENDFYTTRNHLNINKRWKNTIGYIAATFLFPILLAVVLEFR